ncbi:hypothetical protein J0682_27470, partial [Vibrio parahaemolyticus]|nr:hypothetical protein [Vibrio parahaemolyticus]
MNKEKIVIPPLIQGNPFLKTPDEVAELFGFSTSIRSKVKHVARLVGQEVKLSDRSLDNLSGKGVSKQKAEDALDPIFNGLLEQLD